MAVFPGPLFPALPGATQDQSDDDEENLIVDVEGGKKIWSCFFLKHESELVFSQVGSQGI